MSKKKIRKVLKVIVLDEYEYNHFLEMISGFGDVTDGYVKIELVYSYSGCTEFEIVHYRVESDEEYNTRIEKEQNAEKSKNIVKYAKQFISGKDIPSEYIDDVKAYIQNVMRDNS